MADHIFPEQTDTNDAANFAQYHGQSNSLDYVESGLTLSPDYVGLTTTITGGKAYISSSSMYADTSNAVRDGPVSLLVELDTRTVNITDGTTNFIWLDANIDTSDTGADPDTPQIIVKSTDSAPTSESLLLGVVDTNSDTVEQKNRNPDATFNSVTISEPITEISNSTTIVNDYTVGDTDIVFADTTSNSVTVTLSDDETTDGNKLVVVDIGGAANDNPITINTESTQLIDDADSIAITSEYGAVDLFTDGTNWYKIGQASGELDHLESYIRTATGGEVPAVDTTFSINAESITKPVVVLVSPASTAPGFTYEYNYDVSVGYDGSNTTIGVTVNWDSDPGAGNDLDLQIDMYVG